MEISRKAYWFTFMVSDQNNFGIVLNHFKGDNGAKISKSSPISPHIKQSKKTPPLTNQ